MSLRYIRSQAKVGFGTDKQTKYVGRRQLADPFTLDRLAKEVSHHTGQQQPAVETVLRYMILAVEDAIKDGRSVELGDLGTLSPAISTVASDTAAGVKIRRKRVLFRASKKLRAIVESMAVRLISDEDDGTSDTAPDTDNTSPVTPSTGGNTDDDDALQP